MMLMLSPSGTMADSIPCDGSGCCEETNYVPDGLAPLNMTQRPDGFDAKDTDQKAFIYHCVRNFSSLLWFKHIDGTRVPYPWGEGGRVDLPEARHNQTVMILRLKKSDEGTYSYVASNATHNVSGTFHLQVDCRDSPLSFATHEQSVQHVREGSNKTLHCAANKPACPNSFREYKILWMWRNASKSATYTWVKNDTLPRTKVTCNTGEFYGLTCTLHIARVERVHFEGNFLCRFAGNTFYPLNQTIQLVPVEEKLVTWLLPVILSLVAVAVVTVVVIAVWWRCGHRLVFWCRTLPDRGEFDHDAVIVHDQDLEELARVHLKPGLKGLGFDVMDEVATPGKPEVLEKADAILNSYCVILAFSDEELQQSSNRFLTDVTQLKAARSVVFVRCDVTQNGKTDVGFSGTRDDTEDGLVSRSCETDAEAMTSNHVMEEGRSGSRLAEAPDAKAKDWSKVWKDERMKAFKSLHWPRGVTAPTTPSHPIGRKQARQLDKFWYNLRNHLPKPASKSHEGRSSHRRGKRERKGVNSTSSERRLLERSSADRTSSQTADCTTPTRGPRGRNSSQLGVESTNMERQGSGIDQPQATMQAAQNPASYDEPDDVFIDVKTGDTGLGDINPGQNVQPYLHDVVQGRGFPHIQERGYSNDSVGEDPQGSSDDVPAAVNQYRQSAPDGFSPAVQTVHPASSDPNGHRSSVPPRQIYDKAVPTKLEAQSFPSKDFISTKLEAQSFPSKDFISTKLEALSFPSEESTPSPPQTSQSPAGSPDVTAHFSSQYASSPERQSLPPENTTLLDLFPRSNGVASVGGSSGHAGLLASRNDLGKDKTFSDDPSGLKGPVSETGNADEKRETHNDVREQDGPKAPYDTQESGYHSMSPTSNPAYALLN
ncbi:hypothetical protein V1264_010739 [Littorina saxatilis]|uniref:Ig-like domain-containing protein n=2 Tax=Littorina saxatilis TaxID=31220 RepID=A0AAN9G0U1_9CAEN